MVKLVNRAKMTTSTTGTGTITLGSAVDGFQTFTAAGVADGDTVRYCIEDGTSSFELGSGVFTASGTTLTRVVSESSNSDNAINLSGDAIVFITAIAADIQPTTFTTTVFTATANQTTFSVSYTVGFAEVFLNGSKLSAADFTATNGTSIVLASGAAVGDTVDVVAYATQTVANVYTQTQSDARYLQLTGGTLSGDLTGTTSTFSGDVTIADKIVHSGDTNTAIRFPAVDTFAIETDGNERVRVGSSGQIGIGGANYGTAGQVITSGGSSSAISWADPTGGGSADFVATGAISNGDVVVLKSDGTVGTVATSDAVLNPVALGTAATYAAVDVRAIASSYDPDTGKIVIGWRSDTDGYPYAIVGTVSGTSITFGSAVQIQSVNSGKYMKIVYDTTNDKHVFVWAEYISGQEEHGQAAVGTVSGTSISFGSVVEFENSSSPLVTYIDAVYDSVNGKVVIVWNNSVVTNRGLNAIVGTVSGTSISFGSRAIANATSGTNVWCGYDVNAGKVLLGYRTSSPYPSYVGTVSGTSITFGSVVSFTSQSCSGMQTVYDSNAQKILLVYRVGGGGNENTISRVATISGTSVSYGNEVTVNAQSSNGDENFGLAFSTITNTVLISFRDNNDSNKVKLIRGTISGTTLGSLQAEVSTNIPMASLISSHGLVYDTANKKFVLAVADDDNGDNGKAIVISDVTTTTDADNYIGIAEAAISNSATGKITIEGGINESQSSLSIGTNYFVADNGSLTTSNTGRRLGKAISTTKILLDFGIKNVTATETELNYVDGVTSAIQTQLDAKAPLASPTFSGTVNDGDGKIRAIPQSGSDKTSSYTLTTGDVGNFIGIGSGGSITVPNSTFSAGDAISIFNNTSGDRTITLSISTAYLAGEDSDKNSVTLATRGVCTILFISGTVCVLSGNVS